MRTASFQEADAPGSVMRAGDSLSRHASIQPRRAPAPPETPPLGLASYNIHLGIGRDGRFAPERIAAIIRELDADIVCLQEVSLGHPGFDMLTFLSRECGMHGIAGPTLTTSRGDYGNAILTRLDPLEVRRWDLSVRGHEPRGAISMVVKVAGFRWRAIATHLGLRPGERRKQIRRLLGFMQEAGSLPTVLMGDVNEWFLWGRPLRWLHRHFKRTPAPATFPSGWPIFALDRIWVEPNSALHGVRVHRSELADIGSDHLPLKALVRVDAGDGAVDVRPD